MSPSSPTKAKRPSSATNTTPPNPRKGELSTLLPPTTLLEPDVLIRMLLAYSGAVWSDKFPVEWAKEKASTPYGQLPVLVEHEDGTGKEVFRIAQSHAIARYLAAKFGLNPSNPHEHALQDSVFESVSDLEIAAGKFIWEKDEKQKDIFRDQFFDDKLPVFLSYHEKLWKRMGPMGTTLERRLLSRTCDARLEHHLIKAPGLKKLIAHYRADAKLAKYLEGSRCPVRF
ncbi:hypothetical protein BCR33DRAFT_763100 [Rhizoclosmatium globosum]|uniref:GST N-terminal domain-containing protein n=1 Tax=Rhizoclosmatium globosum TaxID=329046 RepID=A0A1Y2CSX4_9FUNG|nr:hypothetical protein BCR33DRAFT_763100 [Rhizoclosmatium globosum]|eukprot:ORY50057.1 hypothetical protein BCR33DRAFT_763100 [Rhizoclosmatium globosum]